MAGKVSAARLIDYVVLPAVLCFVVPFAIASLMPIFKGRLEIPQMDKTEAYKSSTPILTIGVLAIIFVPVFKSLFHLPPYLGMLFSLATVWFFSELLKPSSELSEEAKPTFSVHKALGRIEHSSILFFLGILLAVAALESTGSLFHFAGTLKEVVPNTNIVVMILGFASAVIENVPLVCFRKEWMPPYGTSSPSLPEQEVAYLSLDPLQVLLPWVWRRLTSSGM